VVTAPLLHPQYALYADGILVHACAILTNAHTTCVMNEQQKIERIERIVTPMPKTLIEEIDDFRFGNRLRSRSQAIRELFRRGLGVQSTPQ
jgi:metal-responsive CopG/Arc/MetJ family transcriptional regulator